MKKLRETARGVQAIVSRSCAGFVRKLFENEVPEIYDGTVEIKSISRDAGSRTKIAVYSKDINIDDISSAKILYNWEE